MTEHISQERLKEFREAFALFDKDGDGVITVDEIAEVMRSLGQAFTREDVRDMIKEVDADNTGDISFVEFAKIMADESQPFDYGEELYKAFRTFDKDNSGTIDAAELKAVMDSIGEKLTYEQIDEMMVEADRDGNGSIDYKEFVDLVMRK